MEHFDLFCFYKPLFIWHWKCVSRIVLIGRRTSSSACWKHVAAFLKKSLALSVSDTRNPWDVWAFPRHHSVSCLRGFIWRASSSFFTASVNNNKNTSSLMNATIDPKFMPWSPANKGNPFWKTIKACHQKTKERGEKKKPVSFVICRDWQNRKWGEESGLLIKPWTMSIESWPCLKCASSSNAPPHLVKF